MLLGIMSKIVMHGGKKKFNLENENQPIQSMDKWVGVVSLALDTTHIWNVFLHELSDHTTIHTMENCNSIYIKTTNLLVMLVSLNPPY
jgi:hypothetical protein